MADFDLFRRGNVMHQVNQTLPLGFVGVSRLQKLAKLREHRRRFWFYKFALFDSEMKKLRHFLTVIIPGRQIWMAGVFLFCFLRADPFFWYFYIRLCLELWIFLLSFGRKVSFFSPFVYKYCCRSDCEFHSGSCCASLFTKFSRPVVPGTLHHHRLMCGLVCDFEPYDCSRNSKTTDQRRMLPTVVVTCTVWLLISMLLCTWSVCVLQILFCTCG